MSFKAESIKKEFRPELRPEPHWGSLRRFPRLSRWMWRRPNSQQRRGV